MESTELYLPHKLFLLQSKLKETETNRNCSKEMSLELQSLHNLFLQLKKTLIITMFMGETAFLIITFFMYQWHQESFYVGVQMYIFAKEMANF